jgi:hypothetical protein
MISMREGVMKTPQDFYAATGRWPQHDDMDRVNCPHAGAMGHLCCGWNDRVGVPQMEIGPQAWNGKPMPVADDVR